MEIWKYLLGEGSVVMGAPVIFCTTVSIIGLALWGLINWSYSSRISSLEDRIKLKDDQINDYKSKLNGASPDEAKSRLEELERQVKSLLPRRLSNEQKQILKRAASQFVGKSIAISHDAMAGEVKLLLTDFCSLFDSCGWVVEQGLVMGLGRHPPTGILLTYVRGNPEGEMVAHCLDEMQIEYDLKLIDAPEPHRREVELLLTNKL